MLALARTHHLHSSATLWQACPVDTTHPESGSAMAARILEQRSMALLSLAVQTAGVTFQQDRAPLARSVPSRAGNETATISAPKPPLPLQLHRTTSVMSQRRLPQRQEWAMVLALLHLAQFGRPLRCFEPRHWT